MDLINAQRLLVKLQAFLDQGNGNELSRLERDLMKSYIIQLYDAVSGGEETANNEKQGKVFIAQAKMPLSEMSSAPVVERIWPEHDEPVIPEEIVVKTQEIPADKIPPVPEPVFTAPKSKPKQIPIPPVEKVSEVMQKPKHESSKIEGGETLAQLFELPNVEEMSGRFSHIPIDNIEAALGLNERIFTLKELFGGNRELFESTCATLNNLNSFSEATRVLLNGPASQFNWSDHERIKMAEHFIRIVSRRYPKT